MRKGGNRWVELPPAPPAAVFRRDGCHGTTFQPGQQARPEGPRHRDQEPTDTGPRSGRPTEPDPPAGAVPGHRRGARAAGRHHGNAPGATGCHNSSASRHQSQGGRSSSGSSGPPIPRRPAGLHRRFGRSSGTRPRSVERSGPGPGLRGSHSWPCPTWLVVPCSCAAGAPCRLSGRLPPVHPGASRNSIRRLML